MTSKELERAYSEAQAYAQEYWLEGMTHLREYARLLGGENLPEGEVASDN